MTVHSSALFLSLCLWFLSCGSAVVRAPKTAPGEGRSTPSNVEFENQARKRGLDFRYRMDLRRAKMIATMGGGIAAGDYDNDGDVDLYFLAGITNAEEGTAERGNALFRNRGDGTFEDVAEEAGVDLREWSMGAIFVDLDGDGWLDLYVTSVGPNRHFRNRGDGTFEEIGARSGLDDPRFGAGAAAADFDHDGDLDLVLVNYLEASVEDEMAWKSFVIRTPAEYEGQPAVFFENRGDGTFQDVTDRTGTDNLNGKGLGVRAFDYDRDGWLDIYMANDTTPNKLYRNLGDGTFEDVSLLSGSAVPTDGRPRAGMGVALGDYDNDGYEDLFVTNFASESNSLYRNEEGYVFLEMTEELRLRNASLPFVAWGTAFFDYDLDGDDDLVVANGHLVPGFIRVLGRTKKEEDKRYLKGSYRGPVQLFRNDGTVFTEMAGRAGDLSHLEVSARGLVTVDVDGDGDLDVTTCTRDQKVPLFINDAVQTQPDRHWLVVRPRADGRNPFGVGARVRITAGELQKTRTVCAGSGYLSSEPAEVHFGLGPHDRLDEVRIIWPTGGETVLTDVPADQYLTVREDPTSSD